MPEENEIIFYDIPSAKVGAWSPNTWKTRYCLNYKRIPYKVVWIEYPDIAQEMQKLGIAPTSQRDGKPHYTLPAIWDPKTKRGISDALLIAKYLDDTYPDKPTLFPPRARTVQAPWNDLVDWPHLLPLLPFLLPATLWILNPASDPYFRRKSSVSMEELSPRGEKKTTEWKKIEEGFDMMDQQWFEKGDSFIMGDTVTFADFALGGYLIWMRVCFGVDSEEWKDVSSWSNGRWGRFLKSLEKYEKF
ncbi:hypothetical protein D9758_011899 [Tetrapyrgos nigripes]|uniref:GST N-terminal domain-containing protein n=1 Tax=Tetrapyrgos nigripes TaxID=182062 RepID=A0A8H5CPN8_9AGAR|nr:hypothetical protein D9758_011899 [Tetrapyrgos nigripes]